MLMSCVGSPGVALHEIHTGDGCQQIIVSTMGCRMCYEEISCGARLLDLELLPSLVETAWKIYLQLNEDDLQKRTALESFFAAAKDVFSTALYAALIQCRAAFKTSESRFKELQDLLESVIEGEKDCQKLANQDRPYYKQVAAGQKLSDLISPKQLESATSPNVSSHVQTFSGTIRPGTFVSPRSRQVLGNISDADLQRMFRRTLGEGAD